MCADSILCFEEYPEEYLSRARAHALRATLSADELAEALLRLIALGYATRGTGDNGHDLYRAVAQADE